MDKETDQHMDEPLNSTNELDQLKKELDECVKTRDEYLAGWQRAKADLANYKKEEMSRMQELARYGSEECIRDLIVVIDNFDLAISTLEKSSAVDRGIYMIRSQLLDILGKRGLTRLLVTPGEPFDPQIMEAITETESDGPAGMVVAEIEAGYRLHDKMLRPARVTISKSKEKE